MLLSLYAVCNILSFVFPCGRRFMRCLMFLSAALTAATDSLSSVNSQSHACACVRKVRRGDSQGVRVAPEVLLVPANRGAPKGNKEEKMRLRVISHLRGNC